MIYIINEFESTPLQERILALQEVVSSCLEHFVEFPSDEDASLKLISTLRLLSDLSAQMGMLKTSEFCQAIIPTLECTSLKFHIENSNIDVLQKCIDLINWQIELFDPHTKSLALDDTEQDSLIADLTNTTRRQICKPEQDRTNISLIARARSRSK